MDVDYGIAARANGQRNLCPQSIADYHRSNHLVLQGHGGPQVENLQQILFETAIKWIGSCANVIFITRKPLERVSESIRNQYSDLFKKIVFYYTPTFEDALDKLVGLQSWLNPLPDLLIVESLDLLLTDGNEIDPIETLGLTDWIALRQSLFLACLSDTVRVLGGKLKGDCYSIVSFSDSANGCDSTALAMFAREDNIIDTDTIQGPYDILGYLANLEALAINENEEEDCTR
ncbi:uncharacterized protein LOC125956179 [Anopheles darlingi]|uniref:uncharacterized protein LOC125956179 n=1 Tax=Anopheles darlingi TaxID=43151 RepID=UPI0021001C68|nr:uncharacterized protein LOC125956179 [Anopheles darlingi]